MNDSVAGLMDCQFASITVHKLVLIGWILVQANGTAAHHLLDGSLHVLIRLGLFAGRSRLQDVATPAGATSVGGFVSGTLVDGSSATTAAAREARRDAGQRFSI